MADSALSALTAAAALDGTELHYVVQGGADRKATGAQIATYAIGTTQPVSSMSVTWNSSGTVYTGFGLAITDTASAASSYIFNFAKGGSPFFAMRRDGVIQYSGAYFALNIPDNTVTGGNDRGLYAMDLQISPRSQASQVASGQSSFVAGERNTASGTSAVAIGFNSTASGAYSFAMNGTASGQWAFVTGVSCTGSGMLSQVGGHAATDRGVQCTRAFGGSNFAVGGDNQNSVYAISATTTDATPTKLTANRGPASSTNQVPLPNNSCFYFEAKIAAHRTDATGDGGAFTVTGCIIRDASAATTALVGTPTVTNIGRTDATWTVAATADTTNGALSLTVTGAAGKTIRWSGFVTTVEITS